jgi:hypothetical protein
LFIPPFSISGLLWTGGPIVVVEVGGVTSIGSPGETDVEKSGMFLDFPGASAAPENGLRGEWSANLLITVEDVMRV